MEIKNQITQWIYSKYEETLYDWVSVDPATQRVSVIPLSNVNRATKYLVKSVFGLSEDKVDALTPKEYQELVVIATPLLPNPTQ